MSEQRDQFRQRVEDLVTRVEGWVNPCEWVTKRYPKRMRDDGQVFEIPALYLQRGPTRLLLDPIGYDVPGAEGLVDLYLMPTYDDMASLYFEAGRWVIHYPLPGQFYAHQIDPAGPALPVDEVNPLPLSAETINQVLDAIAANAVH